MNTLQELNSRVDEAEDKINDLENKEVENNKETTEKQQRKKN